MNNTIKFILLFFSLVYLINTSKGQNLIEGNIKSTIENTPVESAIVYIKEHTPIQTTSDQIGNFSLRIKKNGTYTVVVNMIGYKEKRIIVYADGSPKKLEIQLEIDELQLQQVTVEGSRNNKTFGIRRLQSIEGTSINEGKKNEVIQLSDLSANLATNNPRQIFSKVPGINTWESDGSGIQLGIGGRGLSPNRSANFNVRQNGYDISADALGYPESYYTPPTEALERIELIRGAASLQYGTQFGGMLNFVMKQGCKSKPIELQLRNTLGSWGFWNTSTSIGGTLGKINYYTFFQHKQAEGWRPNSQFNQNTSFTGIKWQASKKSSLNFDLTLMSYLAKQPGGLTDKMFENNPRISVRSRNWFNVNWLLPSISYNLNISDKTKINFRAFTLFAHRYAIGNLEDVSQQDLEKERLLLTDEYHNIGLESRILHQYSFGKFNNAILIGARIYQGNTQRNQGFGDNDNKATFNYLDKSNPELSSHQFDGKNISLFAEHIFNINKKLSFTPGIRYEHIFTGIDGYFNERVTNLAGTLISVKKTDQTDGRNRDFLLLGLGISYKIDSTKSEFYANATQNYRAVTFSDVAIFNPNTQIDPNLKDEKGYSIEAGLRGQWHNVFNYDVGGFFMAYDNRIGTTINTQNKRYRTNIADAKIGGLECFTELDFIRLFHPKSKISLSYFSNLAIINAQYYTIEKQFNGNKVELVPSVNWRSGLSFRKNRIISSLTFAYMSKQFTEATNAVKANSSATIGEIPAYYVMDFSIRYIFKRVTLEGSCNNILNTYYFTRRADGYPGPGILPSDPRSFFVTLGIRI
ncbi:MAG: TonB-dependent receptor [Cytophagales bacterium]|nr:MAG: TonB-dependent receptor [Cytophagales bacterium]